MKSFTLTAVLIGILATGVLARDTVELKDGDTLHGTILERYDNQIVLQHPTLGRLVIPVDQIVKYTGQPINKIIVKSEKPPKWKHNVVVGGSLTNDDDGKSVDFNIRIRSSRKTDETSTSFDVRWIYGLDESVVSDNKFTAFIEQRWLEYDSPWFYWFRPRFDSDQFRSWEQRITAHGGAGRELWKDEEVALSGLVGFGFRKDFGSEDNELSPELAFGFTFGWKPRDRHKFNVSSTYFPVTNRNDYRILSQIDWTWKLDDTGLSLNTHIEWELATDPDPGFPRNNIIFTWGLQWEF